ncbi:Lar family restriction alleviation protein [Burkholderia gladioli]|uniref:Lar family restriction alleviation protein n=1 Tax=Burkholderia gladioli TaxID=28095 RepID=UPI001640AF02|nr:Lar family restriction alleviation protein [Burkholderia gladioli]
MSDKLSDESLPCPFCGCTDISEGEVLTDNPDGGASTQSMCRGCGALGPDAHLREGEVDFGSVKSTAAWNRRASPAPAITMPTLNDAMRAVLTNEHCIYGTPDELYAALVKAAPAIPAVNREAIIEQCAALADSMAAQGYPANVIGRDIRALKAAPAISESEDALLTAARRAIPALAHAAERNPAYQRDYEELSKAIEDAARKGEKS